MRIKMLQNAVMVLEKAVAAQETRIAALETVLMTSVQPKASPDAINEDKPDAVPPPIRRMRNSVE